MGGLVAFPTSCLPLPPLPHVCLCWMACPASGRCLPSSPMVIARVCLCWIVHPLSQGLVSLVSQLVSLLVSLCGGWPHFCPPPKQCIARSFQCFLMCLTLFLKTCLESTHCFGFYGGVVVPSVAEPPLVYLRVAPILSNHIPCFPCFYKFHSHFNPYSQMSPETFRKPLGDISNVPASM